MRTCSWPFAPVRGPLWGAALCPGAPGLCRWGKRDAWMLALLCLLLAGCGNPPTINTLPPVVYSTATPPMAPLSLYFTAIAPSPQDALRALNASDGALRWTYQANATVQPHPVVDQQVVYLGSADGRVSALEAASGSRRWSSQVEGFPLVAAVTEGGVYGSGSLGYGGDPFSLPPDGAIFALNARDGSSKWTTALRGVVLGVVAGVVYVGSAEAHTLSALRASDGKLQWQFRSMPPLTSVLAAADQVFLLAGGQDTGASAASLTALNASTGAPQWTYAARKPSDDLRLIGVDAQTVYLLALDVASASPSASLVALDAHAGRVRWQTQASAALSAVVESGVVYVGAAQGRVAALDGATGRVRWQTQASGKNPVHVVLVANGMVYTESDGLTALHAGDGSLVWRYQSNAFAQVLAERDGVLYAFSNGTLTGQLGDDYVLALGTSDGTRLWQYDAGAAPIFPVLA